jgi:hypothetical protein
MAALRLKGLSASFHDTSLMQLADEAIDPRRANRASSGKSASTSMARPRSLTYHHGGPPGGDKAGGALGITASAPYHGGLQEAGERAVALLSLMDAAAEEPSGLRGHLPIGGRSVLRHQVGWRWPSDARASWCRQRL